MDYGASSPTRLKYNKGMTPLPAEQDVSAPFRLGVIGCEQARLRYHAALHGNPRLKVVAISDPDERYAKVWARELGTKPAVAADAADLSAQDLNGVLVCLPLDQRAEAIAEALRADLPVLAEVPVADNLTVLDDLYALAVSHNVPLVPALPRRFDPYVLKATEIVTSGMLGTVQHTRCSWAYPIEIPVPDADTISGSWSTIVQAMACQTADLVDMWHGEPFTVSADVDVSLFRKREQPAGRQKPDATLATIITAHACGQATHQLMRTRSVRPDERYHLTGSRGQLELTLNAGPTSNPAPALVIQIAGEPAVTVKPEIETHEKRISLPTLRALRMLDFFSDCARGNAKPLHSPRQFRVLLEVVHATFISTLEASKVNLPLLRSPDLDAVIRTMLGDFKALPPSPH